MYCIKDIDAQVVITDKGYDAWQRVVDRLLTECKQVVIPSIGTRKTQRQYDRNLYKVRHLLENSFARLKLYTKVRHFRPDALSSEYDNIVPINR